MKKGSQKVFKDKEMPMIMLVVLLVFYLIATILLTVAARSDYSIVLFGEKRIPFASFTGVFSSIANICIIFTVLFFKKKGFIISLVLLLFQFSVIIFQIVRSDNLASISGLFSLLLTIIAITLIYTRSLKVEKYQGAELEYLNEQKKFSQRLFEQTARALVNSIDAKDKYSHGHSLRVAGYSRKIAEKLGKNEDDCRKIYYAGLLHDVGKIGVLDSIITKEGKLTPKEYDEIKQHPVKGYLILSGISEYPYLSIGAHYHHERYDGQGYPERLKGEDIPEIARIISVADAYDAMTSKRSYRAALPQQLVREEIVKGIGTQFDPQFAKIMLQLIDQDAEYQLKEKESSANFQDQNEIYCDKLRDEIFDNIIILGAFTRIHLKVSQVNKKAVPEREIALVVFDSLDGHVHDTEKEIKDLNYFEYAEILPDGTVNNSNCRKVKSDCKENSHNETNKHEEIKDWKSYDIEAVKVKDHVLVRINDWKNTRSIILALPDSTRYVYLGITGENSVISNIKIDRDRTAVDVNYIPRIAEEISYIKAPAGDIPNVQIDSHMTSASQGIELKNSVELKFHTMSLPTARLIWHCPYVVVYSSKDGNVRGEDYKEYALLRLDGELIESMRFSESDPFSIFGNILKYEHASENELSVTRKDDFESWETWKEKNKKGFDSTIEITRNGNTIVTTTQNCGIQIRNTTNMLEENENVYVALTGDQCALTNIRFTQK